MRTEPYYSEYSLTPQDWKILRALSAEPTSPGIIANRAGIQTSSPRETASHHCIRLTRKGFAEKTGTAMLPKWMLSERGKTAIAGRTA